MSTSMNPQSGQRQWFPLLTPMRNADIDPLVICSEGESICGNGPDVDLRMDCPGIEARHCRFFLSGGQLTVAPLDGSVWVNCVQVVEDSPVFVGDHLLMGTSTLRVDSADSAQVRNKSDQDMANTPPHGKDDSRRAIQQHMSILERQLFGMRNRSATDGDQPSAARPAILEPAPEAAVPPSEESNDCLPCGTISAPVVVMSDAPQEAEFKLEERDAELNERETQLKALTAELRDAQKDMQLKLAGLDEDRVQLENRTADITGREEQLARQEEAQVELEQQKVVIEELRADADRERAAADELRADLERQRSEAEELRSQADHLRQEAEHVRIDSDGKAEELAAREQELSERAEKLVESEQRCVDRDREITLELERLARDRDELEQKQKEIDELNQTFDGREDGLAEREAAVQSRESELQSQADQRAEELNSRESRIAEREQQADAEDRRLAEQADAHRALEGHATQLDTLRQELDQRQQSLQTQADEIAGKESEFNERQLELDAGSNELQQTQESLQQERGDLESQRGDIEAQRNELQSQMDGIRSELDGVKSQRDELQGQKEQLESLCSELETQRNDLNSRVEELQQSAGSTTDAEESLRRVREEADADKEVLEARIREYEASHESSSSQEQHLLDQVNELRAELAAAPESRDADHQETLAKVAEQDTLIERMTGQLEAAEAALSSIDSSAGNTDRADQVEAENKELQLRLEQRDAQVRNLTAKMKELESGASQSGVSTEKLAALTQELDERRTQILRREEELTELQRQYEAGMDTSASAPLMSSPSEPEQEPADMTGNASVANVAPTMERSMQTELPGFDSPAMETSECDSPEPPTMPESERENEPMDDGTYSPATSGVTHLRTELASLFGLGGQSSASEPAPEPEQSFEQEGGLPEPVAPDGVVPAAPDASAVLIADEPEDADGGGSDSSTVFKTVSLSFADNADVLQTAKTLVEEESSEPAEVPAEDVATPPASSGEGDDGNDYVTKYMEELLSRNRTGAGESLPSELNPSKRQESGQSSKPSPVAARPIVASSVSSLPDVPATSGAPERPVAPAMDPARRQADLDAMRKKMQSFRQFSAHSVQSALESHAKKTYSSGIRGRWAVLIVLLFITGFAITASVMDAINSPLTVVVLMICCIISGMELRKKKRSIRTAMEEPEPAPTTVAPQGASLAPQPAGVSAPEHAGTPGVVTHAAPQASPDGQSAYVQYHSR